MPRCVKCGKHIPLPSKHRHGLCVDCDTDDIASWLSEDNDSEDLWLDANDIRYHPRKWGSEEENNETID